MICICGIDVCCYLLLAGRNYNREPAPGTSVFNFEKADDDEAFELVDNKPVKKTSGPRRPQQNQGRWANQAAGGRQQEGRGGPRPGQGGAGRPQQGFAGGRQQQWKDQQRERNYTPSIDIRPDWQVLGDQIALSAMQKLSGRVGEHEELVHVGAPGAFDRSADRVLPKVPTKLVGSAMETHLPPIWDDPIVQQLAAENKGDVFMSDLALSVIMTAPRSIYPWDIAIVKKGDILFFDRRKGSSLELVTNGETAPDPLMEDSDSINGIEQLNRESTMVNNAFKQQFLKPGDKADDLPDELKAAGNPPPAFSYRCWALGETRLVVRCQIDGCVRVGNTLQNIALHALNEFDPKWSGIDWRTKLDTQRGAVLATELKNNATKMARWTAAALLSGIDMIKLGYISRASFRNSKAHMLLGTQAVKPKDFAAQMNLNMENAWGIAIAMINLCKEKMLGETGTFFRSVF